MNSVVLIGRLCKDPEVRETQNGKTITRYTLAVNRRGKDQGADFINCVAFEKAGDFAGKYFMKGLRVAVRGRIQTGSYEKKDGSKVYTTDVIVEEQEFADGKAGVPAAEPAPAPAKEPRPVQESFMDIPAGADDEGLPWNQ